VDILVETGQERLKFIFDSKQVPYKWLDLNTNQKALAEVREKYGNAEVLPQVIVNSIDLGGAAEVQELEDEGYLDDILSGGKPHSNL